MNSHCSISRTHVRIKNTFIFRSLPVTAGARARMCTAGMMKVRLTDLGYNFEVKMEGLNSLDSNFT